MRSFRGLRYFLAPPWLTGRGDGEKVAFTIEWILDAFLERLRQGLNSRFPTRAGESALSLIIGDRGLLRGRAETAAAVAARLLAWRTPRTHRVRGNAYEVLLQIWHYWGGIYAATIDSHGLRHQIGADDTPDANELADPDLVEWTEDAADPYSDGPGNEILWDSGDPIQPDGFDANTYWSRFWVVLQPTAAMAIEPSPDFGDAALWGGEIGVPGYLLGQVGATAEDVSAMRRLFQELKWNPAHAVPEWLILVFDGDDVDAILPDGYWQYWSKNDAGTRVAARSGDYRYWSLDPARNNTYSGLRTRPWPAAATQVDGTGTYTGDRSNAAAWGAITLPGGATYTGVRGSFPRSVLLVDDGSVVR